MSERITDARLRELTAAMPDRMGGTLVDTLLLRELAAEILAARTDDARTLAAEAAARGAAFREREAANEAAMLRAQVDALTAEVARSAEAMRRQAAAVRTLDAGRAERDAYEQRTLRSLAGVARAALLAELDEARRERDDWNARATALEAECDALTARVVDAEAEAARRTDAVVAIGDALGREGATAGECVRLIGRLTNDLDAATMCMESAREALDDVAAALGVPADWDAEWGDRVRAALARPTMEPHP